VQAHQYCRRQTFRLYPFLPCPHTRVEYLLFRFENCYWIYLFCGVCIIYCTIITNSHIFRFIKIDDFGENWISIFNYESANELHMQAVQSRMGIVDPIN
jgi:hypothetical protein